MDRTRIAPDGATIEAYREAILDPARLVAERPRLVRYCARVTRDYDAAEDLAQEVLVTAWQHRHQLRDFSVWQAWLTGIARNICARHTRKISIEQKRMAAQDDSETPLPHSLEHIADERHPDPEAYLEHQELSQLLDKALGALPRSTHEMLIARYVENLSVAEIATSRGIREEAAAVQLHRSRQALRRALIGPNLREESISLGILDEADDRASSVETRIWCPKCGRHHLRGRLVRGQRILKKPGLSCPLNSQARILSAEGGIPEYVTEFALMCPECDGPDKNFLVHMMMLRSAPNGSLLDGVQGFKPALNRVSAWWGEFAKVASTQRFVACYRCGHRAQVYTMSPKSDEIWGIRRGEQALVSRCGNCGHSCSMGVMDIALNVEAGRAFWRENPRLIAHPSVELLSADGLVVISRLESLQSRQALDIVCRADTLQVIRAERVG